MDKPNKKVILITLSAVFLIVAIVAAFRYFPLNRIMSIGSGQEKGYISQSQTSEKAPNSLFFGFEVDPGKGESSGLYKGIAHSGNFSAKVFGKNTYSIPVDRKISEIGPGNLDAVGMSSWVYIFPTTHEINGAFVFTINNDLGVNICWKGISVSGNDLPQGKWFKISGLFNLTDLKLKPEFKMQIYFWNNSSSDILVDDFYAVFGGQKARKGDSTLVDMTKGIPFQPKFNYPPYPVTWLGKQVINNQDSPFLIKSVNLSEGEISPADKIFSGNFTSNTDGREDLLAVKSGGAVELYHFCGDKTKFIRILVTIPPGLARSFVSGRIIPGKFLNPSATLLLIITGEEVILGGFDPVKQSCPAENAAVTAFKVIWKVPLQKAVALGVAQGTQIAPGDFDGDRITELFTHNPSGSWNLLKINSSPAEPMKIQASGNGNPVPEWQQGSMVSGLSSGKFLGSFDQDLLLTIFKSADGRNEKYSLRRFVAVSGKFEPVFRGRSQFAGKTVGLDTLHADDRFFTGRFDKSGKEKVIRYCREWRFDMKEIRFNDTTFQVMSGLDFKGYEKDHNPRYFDVLQVVQGRFLDPGTESLMVTGRSCKKWDENRNACSEFQDLPFLPNTLQFYSFETTKK